jgi:HK97 family phage prohead protease
MQLEERQIELFNRPNPLKSVPPRATRRPASSATPRSSTASRRPRRLPRADPPRAFKASLNRGNDVRALVDHDSSKLLGRTSNKTLRLEEDAKGLRVEIDMPDTSYARDLLASVKRGDIRGMSFGFIVPKGGDRFASEGGKTIRELRNIDLHETTVTSIPAYGATSITVRVDPASPPAPPERPPPDAQCG